MPTYDYRCQDCAYEFEAVQSMVDAPLSTCPTCDGFIQRIISQTVGIAFKGSGFYANDNHQTTSSSAPAKSKPKNKAKATTTSSPKT